MPRTKIGPAQPDRKALDVEIARLRELDVAALRARWHTVFGRRSPSHLPRHLLFRILAYQLQADLLGDLDAESQRLLDRSETPEKAGQRAVTRRPVDVRPGTMLGREWNGQMQRVTVLQNGFAWKGKSVFICPMVSPWSWSLGKWLPPTGQAFRQYWILTLQD